MGLGVKSFKRPLDPPVDTNTDLTSLAEPSAAEGVEITPLSSALWDTSITTMHKYMEMIDLWHLIHFLHRVQYSIYH